MALAPTRSFLAALMTDLIDHMATDFCAARTKDHSIGHTCYRLLFVLERNNNELNGGNLSEAEARVLSSPEDMLPLMKSEWSVLDETAPSFWLEPPRGSCTANDTSSPRTLGFGSALGSDYWLMSWGDWLLRAQAGYLNGLRLLAALRRATEGVAKPLDDALFFPTRGESFICD